MNDAMADHSSAVAKQVSNERKPARPNYNQLHAKSLPLEVYPLPAFIPHNPLSAFRIAYFFLGHLFFPPTSHPPVLYKATFSPKTRSVNVTDPVSIRALWEKGFFGKGTLSRSEPTWLQQEKRRRGVATTETAEEITERRRRERREMKRDRARKERKRVEEQLKKESEVEVGPDGITDSHHSQIEENGEPKEVEEAMSTSGNEINSVLGAALDKIALDEMDATSVSKEDTDLKRPNTLSADLTRDVPSGTVNIEQENSIKDQEHLQLSYEEAFFLTYGLGILDIYSEESQDLLSNLELLQIFRQHSYFPTRPSSRLQLDDPFLLSYVVYHHFRSLGWVVRHGLKFAVDFLLYNRGPVFSHAEFAVIVIPAYEHAYWSATPARVAETRKKTTKSWWWLHGVNRVQAQVRKNLVLAYVEIPPEGNVDGVGEEVQDIGSVLKRYKVREFILKRWTPNRNRD